MTGKQGGAVRCVSLLFIGVLLASYCIAAFHDQRCISRGPGTGRLRHSRRRQMV